MSLTTRPRRQVASSLFPRSFWTFRNLSLRVPDNGIRTVTLPFSFLSRILPLLTEYLQNSSRTPKWSQFRSVTEDRLELVEPAAVTVNVAPTTWWCTNAECNKFFSGTLGQVGIRNASCPACRQRSLVQFASIFMCPVCHIIESVESVICRDCNDSRSIVLVGAGGRRREYRWKCRQHPGFVVFLGKNCPRDGNRMVLKSTGGRIYQPAVWSHVSPQVIANFPSKESTHLRFLPSRANVVDIIVGRIPVADVNAFFRGIERSIVEPFINPDSGNFMGFVSRLETDAITVAFQDRAAADDLGLHSLKHALLNAAPAVTGLIQEEFGAHINVDRGELIIFDNVSGGSGGCRLLVDRRLSRWLQVAHELAECHQVQCEDACRGCLFLPARICRQGNNLLDRRRVLALIP
jgi:hypothetical protein